MGMCEVTASFVNLIKPYGLKNYLVDNFKFEHRPQLIGNGHMSFQLTTNDGCLSTTIRENQGKCGIKVKEYFYKTQVTTYTVREYKVTSFSSVWTKDHSRLDILSIESDNISDMFSYEISEDYANSIKFDDAITPHIPVKNSNTVYAGLDTSTIKADNGAIVTIKFDKDDTYYHECLPNNIILTKKEMKEMKKKMNNVIDNEVLGMFDDLKRGEAHILTPKIESIYANKQKGTIVIKWKTGETTKVTCHEDDNWDIEKGIMACIAKYVLGNNYNAGTILNKYINSVQYAELAPTTPKKAKKSVKITRGKDSVEFTSLEEAKKEKRW